MAVQSPPFALQNGSHSAALFRQALSSLLYQAGPMDPGSLVVSAQATPNMSVQVNGGATWVPGSQVASIPGTGLSTQADYFALNDAAVTLTIAASDPTNPRIDIVYVAVNDQQYSGSTNNAVLAVATGTPAGTPVAPTLPNNAIALAQVRVNATVISITNSNITAVATGQATGIGILRGTVIPCTSATRPTSVRLGHPIFETDTRVLRVWNGTAWDAQDTIACTSTTRPTGVRSGQMIYETDTGRTLVYTGSAWVGLAGQIVGSLPAAVPDTAWTSATLQNSWVAYGSNFPVPRYRKLSDGTVLLSGMAKSGTISTTLAVFTLPAGYRPSISGSGAQLIYPACFSDAFAEVRIDNGGNVYAWSGSATIYINFEGVRFLAEQ